MWYKCLNPNCGYIFNSTESCDKCPDCGKQDFREATSEEIESVKPSLDDVIKGIEENKPQPPKNSSNSSNDDEPVLEITRDNKSVKQEPEREL